MLRSIKLLALLAFAGVSVAVSAVENRIDIIRHDAPELAKFGSYDIGVRTLELTDSNRIDILNIRSGSESVFYDRNIKVEVWYPAALTPEQNPQGVYHTTTRNTAVNATLRGSAVRDAAPEIGGAAYPLVIISHGYPGNRYLLIHTGENLASKGYVVVAIEHPDSTYENQKSFRSTLYNRPLDQRFVLNAITELSENEHSFLQNLVNTDNSAVIGFSMGAFGLVNNLGAGYSDRAVKQLIAPPNGLLADHATSNPDYRKNLDPRIKAGVAIAPWGMNNGMWSSEDLAGIETPTFYIAGSKDKTAGYKKGTRAIFEQAVNSDRYLLTFINAGHSAAAPYPLPAEIQRNDDQKGASHYTDPVWDTLRMNNVMDHFVTAFLDLQLKGKTERHEYLNVIVEGGEGKYSMSKGQPKSDHSYWKGFADQTAEGMTLEHRAAK